MRAAEWLDRSGHAGIAIRGTTLVYGLEYFRGVRSEAGSIGEAARALLAHARHRRRQGAPA